MSRTHEQLMRADLESLMLNDSFKRFIYCVLMDANVFARGLRSQSSYSPNRRAVVLWAQTSATMQTVNPDALLAICRRNRKPERRRRMADENQRLNASA